MCSLLSISGANAAEYQIAPVPGWVKPLSPALQFVVPSEQVRDGTYYLLGDFQSRLSAPSRDRFRHFAMQAINEKGVEFIANIEVVFDPTFQTLTLHQIDVIREGTRIPKLATAKVRVLQREKSLEYRIYDGSKSASVFLEDIRVGDIVEYAYTVSGSNPVFAGLESGGFDLQWAVPLHHFYARLLLSAGSPATVSLRNSKLEPTTQLLGNQREYVWERRDTPPLVVESDAPGWYDPWPVAAWSEYADWQAVVAWAQPLYRVPEQLDAALAAEVKRIAAAHSTREAKVREVLRLVQSQVRYLGVEVGKGSHAPREPAEVFERRFGDCKDKARLTITLLDALGIEAHPALVHTSRQRGIADLLPSPDAFNHVIVHLRLGDRDVWLDPTRALQVGDLDRIVQPDFGLALIVAPATAALSSMKSDPQIVPKRDIRAVFDARAGLDKPALYTITTVSEFAGAETMRDKLATSNLVDVQTEYLKYYGNYYPSISVAAPMQVTDDTKQNRITVVEHYSIADFWPYSASNKRKEATIHVPEMDGDLRAPESTQRNSPIAVAHPTELVYHTQVLLPEDWPANVADEDVVDPAFEFKHSTRSQGSEVNLVDHYRSKTDHVEAGRATAYVQALEKSRDELAYMLYMGDPVPTPTLLERINWTLLLVAALLLAVFVWMAARIYHYDPPASRFVAVPALVGLSGWLILVAIGIVLTPLATLIQLQHLIDAMALPRWLELTQPGGADYHALYAPVLLFELAANLAMLVFGILLIVLFFSRRRSTPVVFIAYFVGVLCISVIDLVAANQLPGVAGAEGEHGAWSDIAVIVVKLLIWGSYFLVSVRVKSTFTRTWKTSPPPLPPQSTTTVDAPA